MIKVFIKRINDCISSIEIKGHAESGPYGHDLVCAAVSAVFTGGCNTLKDVKNYHIKIEEGYAFINAYEKVSIHDEVVLETIVTSLETIKESNSKFIEIKNV